MTDTAAQRPTARAIMCEVAGRFGWERREGPETDLFKRGEEIITFDWRDGGRVATDISRYCAAGIERANHPVGLVQARRWMGDTSV